MTRRGRAIFLLSATAAVAFWGCQETLTGKGPLLTEYQGMLLPPGVVETPAAHEAYVTMPGDTTYMLARRFYEEGWKLYVIQQTNRERVGQITLANGTLEPGRVLFLPSNAEGIPLKRVSYPK